jgi:hypothetical protein
MAIGFQDGDAYLFGPIQKTTERAMARLSWNEMELASRAIDEWARDLLRRWPELQNRWAPYIEVHGERL